jgi:pimeloyl-ACP methyl ester carboxylesterase
MSDGLLGLDPADCRGLVTVLKRSAQQLELVASEVNRTVARTGWQGQDSQRFRAQWPANRQRLTLAAKGLEGAASELLREIAEQERASAVDHGGNSLWDDMVDAGKDLWDELTEGAGNLVNSVAGTQDAVRDGLGWLGKEIVRLPVIRPAWNFLNQLGELGTMVFDALTGKPPSISALFAQLALTAGTGINAEINRLTLGLMDFRLFDDGRPSAGDPIAVGPNTDRNDLTLPTSASSIFQGVVDAYDGGHVPGTETGEVRIVKVQQPDGSYAYIVNIPGTEDWGITGGAQGRDLTSNLMVMAGQSSSAQQAIVLAMQKAGIPSGAPVMLAGHSQGGMLAVALASDPNVMANYNITNVMTAGSPVDGAGIDPRVKVLEVQHSRDIIPQLDLGGIGGGGPVQPANVTVVTMADPPRNAEQSAELTKSGAGIGESVGRWLPGVGEDAGRNLGATAGQAASDAGNNHDFINYRDSMADRAANPGIAGYENAPSLQVFLSDDPAMVSAVDVPTGRR